MSETIVVDRETGKVFHRLFGNESYPVREVIDNGSSVSSFKVFARSKQAQPRVVGGTPFANTTYFQISTYVEETEIPFLAVSSDAIGTGVCR